MKENQSNLNQYSHSIQITSTTFNTSVAPYQESSDAIDLPTLTTSGNTQGSNNFNKEHEDERVLGLHYEQNRLNQEKLLLVTNIFRLVIIVALAFVVYFVI